MAYIGNILVPEITPSGTFPLVPDYPWGRAHRPQVIVHQFGSRNAKTEQRFCLGNGSKRFTVRKAGMTEADRIALVDFWELNQGGYGAFTYNAPNDNGVGTTAFTCRFEDQRLTWEFLLDFLSQTGVALIEIPAAVAPYTLNFTLIRFPDGTLTAALLPQAQRLIPLVKITPKETGYPAMYLSDRACQVGSQVYQPRLLEFDGIAQGLGGESDEANFTFGNADRVMMELANDVDLYRASLEFSLFHVSTGIKLDLWKGDVIDWSFDAGPVFSLRAADGLYELNLPYPTRRISRTCWKRAGDGVNCTPGPTFDCDKGFSTPNGCVSHSRANQFGGIIAVPQAVRTKDNSTGTWGFGRSPLTSTSLVADSIYDQVVPEIYCNFTEAPEGDWSAGLPINAKIAAGRDEGDFYTALGIVGEGPIGLYAGPYLTSTPIKTPHLLDGAPPHGLVAMPRSISDGIRLSAGADPNPDPFALGEGGEGKQSWGAERAAGTAFAEIRRIDQKGLQLSKLSEHAMQVTIRSGLGGWVWTGPGSKSGVSALTNPVWIAINAMLRALGLRAASASVQEGYFDVAAAVVAAGICNEVVDALVGPGTETQFQFVGIIQEEKPLRDWITEILQGCLGYFTFSFGKLRIGIRVNSSVIEPFTAGSILFNSLALSPLRPSFNHLTANFADEEFQFVSNSVQLYDIDHAKLIGGVAPQFLKASLNLAGCPTKSQALRVVQVRLGEELGGIDTDEWREARNIAFKTTVLALNVEPGMVCSMTHDDMPGGSGEFRVISWRLNKDFSIDIQGRTTTDGMYDPLVGPKPADVPAPELPVEGTGAPGNWSFALATAQDGQFSLSNFQCKVNGATVHQGAFDVYYVDESAAALTVLTNALDQSSTTINYLGEPPVAGDAVLIDSELMRVLSVTPTTENEGAALVERGFLGTTAAVHMRVGPTAVLTVNPDWKAQMTVAPGLALRPGERHWLVHNAADAEIRIIASYDPVTGNLFTTRPFPEMEVGHEVYADPRIWRVRQKNVMIAFPPRFFRSPERSVYQHAEPLQFGGIAFCRGYLENTQGVRSLPYDVSFVTLPEHRLRTLGTTEYVFRLPLLVSGSGNDLFGQVATHEAQCWEHAYFELTYSAIGPPILSPRSIGSISPGNFVPPGGTITLGGSIAEGDKVWITIGTGIGQWVRIPVLVVGENTAVGPVSEALRDWMNACEEFRAYFYAGSDGAGEVSITDYKATGGLIATEVEGGITAMPDGMDSIMGVLTGRRYACTFYQESTGCESELGIASLPPRARVTHRISTGPTGGAARIEFKDLPVSIDARVSHLRIYAQPDGVVNRYGPWYRVAQIANGATEAQDVITEANLASQGAYGGPVQPSRAGPIKITVNRDGSDWIELRLAGDEEAEQIGARSNVIEGLALDPAPAGTVFSIDINNGIAPSATLTFTGLPGDGQLCTIDGLNYTFQATLTDVPGNVKLGPTRDDCADNLKSAINLDAGAGVKYAASTVLHPTCSASNPTPTTVLISYKAGGTSGNGVAISESLDNVTLDRTTLQGGEGSDIGFALHLQ